MLFVYYFCELRDEKSIRVRYMWVGEVNKGEGTLVVRVCGCRTIIKSSTGDSSG